MDGFFMRIAFLSFPDYGHIFPCLELLDCLHKKGAELNFFSTEKFRQILANYPIQFSCYPHESSIEKQRIDGPIDREGIISQFYSLFTLLNEFNKRIFDNVYFALQEWKPDVIIYDHFISCGKSIADSLQKPAICSISSFIYEEKYIHGGMESFINKYFTGFKKTRTADYYRLKEILEMRFKQNCDNTLQNPLTLYAGYGNFNIVYTSKAIQPDSRSLSGDYLFIGRRTSSKEVNGQPEWLERINTPILYVSFGTVFSFQPELLSQCINALRNLDYHAIISVRDARLIQELGEMPEHIHLYPFVPQIEVLKRASIFITHGGFNSINEALYCSVPMLVCPQALDQFYMADWIEKLGCGISLRKRQPDEFDFKKAILKLSSHKFFGEHCRKIGETLRKEDKYDAVWDAILNFKEKFS